MTALPHPHHARTTTFSLEGSNSLQERGLPWSAPQLAAAALKAIDILLKVASAAANPVEARRAASAVLRFIQVCGVQAARSPGEPAPTGERPQPAASPAPPCSAPADTASARAAPPHAARAHAAPAHAAPPPAAPSGADRVASSPASASSSSSGEFGRLERTVLAAKSLAPPLGTAVQRLLDAAGSTRRREAG